MTQETVDRIAAHLREWFLHDPRMAGTWERADPKVREDYRDLALQVCSLVRDGESKEL